MADKIITSLLVNTAVFSVLFCAVLPMRKIAGKRISPVLMLVMWLAVVIKLVIPFGFESGFSILPTTAAAENQPYEYAHNIYDNIPDAHAETYNAIQPSDYSANVSVLSENSSETSAVASGNRTGTAASIDWAVIALCIWGAGVVTVAAVLRLSASNLRRRIKHARTETPHFVFQMAEQCRKELGIRRSVGIIFQSAIDKPVIMGAIRPLLVLPENAGQLKREALRHVLLHELTHFKGGDLWAITFMNMLRALYWFNPLVWICFRLIREDIEIACDQRVIKSLGQEHRLSYIETVLSFAGRKTPDRFAAAMGLLGGRPSMERRIKGMFGKTRTGLKGRITAGVIAVLILAVSALTACQPVSLVQTPVPAAEYEVTGHWNETVSDGKLTIKIDTDILEPKVSEYPVVKVEPLVFTQQRVDELVNYFAKGRRLYKPQGKTKSDYQKEIDSLLTPYWSGGRQVVTAQARFQASQLEREMANAPDSYPKEYMDSTLTYDIDYETKAERPESGKNFLQAMLENGDGNDPRISVWNYTEGYANWTGFVYNTPQSLEYLSETKYKQRVYDIGFYGGDFSADDERKNNHIDEFAALFDKVTLDEDNARAQAEKAINDLGIKDMILVDASRAVSLEYPDEGGWQFEYVRQNGGTPVCAAGIVHYSKGLDIYLYASPESLSVLVTDNGIEYFVWNDCSKETERVSDSEKLLPFGDIKQALKQRISEDTSERLDTRGYELLSGELAYNKKDLTFMVKSARLCMCNIGTEYEDNRLALIIPVWVFETEFGYYDPIRKQTVRCVENPYIIDARDGTVMEGTIIASQIYKY